MQGTVPECPIEDPKPNAEDPNPNFEDPNPNIEDPNLNMCEDCGKSFATLKTLRKHKGRCKGMVNPLQCPECLRVFSSVQVRYNHKRNCKGPESNASNTVNNNYYQCPITTNNNTQNNITINVANFNAEKTDHITQEFARWCFDKGAYGITPMVDKIYFNEDHPENHNVKLESLNHSLVEVYKGGVWRVEGLLTTIDNMITNSTGTMMMKMNRPLNTEGDLEKWCAIQNLAPDHKRKIREHTKGKLVERRKKD